ADVGQAQGVAVAADARDRAMDHPGGVGMVDRPEPQLIHHGHRPGPHGDDVAHDATHPGGRALVGLHVAGVVVGLDLEGHRPTVTDVDDARVLAHAHQELLAHLLGDALAEASQVLLGGLVGAVLGPHHRVHGQLRVGGAAAQDLADALI